MDPPYLCQVGRRVSCAACCGLYNVRNLSAVGLKAMLVARTNAFDRVPRQEEAIEAFGRRQRGWAPEERPFPQFHHCPYVGLIGRGHRRVGCLLHPAVPGNAGRDWRTLSYYGAKACRTYFCPTSQQLGAEHQMIIRQGIDHWYLYGLMITEHRLWKAFFEQLEGRIGRRTTWSDFAHPRARALLQAFAGQKINWPFRRAQAPGPCHFFFEDGHNPRPAVERMDAALPISPYEMIFREFESSFARDADMRQAERLVEGILDGLAAVISNEQHG